MSEATPLFSVYLSQAGSHVTAIIDQHNVSALYDALYKTGVSVGLWTAIDKTGQSTGIVVNPRRGGWVLNMEPAQAIPCLPDNKTPLTAQELAICAAEGHQIPGWLKPEDMPKGQTVFPAWSLEESEVSAAMGALADHQLGAGIEAPATNAPPEHVAAPVPPPMPTPATQPAAPKGSARLEAYLALQAEATELGISPVNKKAEWLHDQIAQKRAEQNNGAGVHA